MAASAPSAPSSAARAAHPPRKRRSSQSLDSTPSKGDNIAVDLHDGYSEAEQAVLRQAATILGISLEGLLAAAKTSRHIASVFTTDTDAPPSSDSDHAEDSPPEGAGPFTLTLPPIAKRRSRPGTSSSVKHHPASRRPNVNQDLSDLAIPCLSNFSEPALEVGSELVSFSGDTHELAAAVDNQWDLDFYNYPNMWDGNDMQPLMFPNPESAALAPVPSISASEDTPIPSYEEEAFDSLQSQTTPVHPSIALRDAPGDSSQNSQAAFDDDSLTTSSRRFEDVSLENSKAPDRPSKRKATSSPGDTNNTKIKRRGPFLDAEKRHETGLTRKLVACIRCRMQRIRVSQLPTARVDMLNLSHIVFTRCIGPLWKLPYLFWCSWANLM
jgi:hypothetical protein